MTHRGIKVNFDQVKVINNLQPPRNSKEVQKLTGMTTAFKSVYFSIRRQMQAFFLINE